MQCHFAYLQTQFLNLKSIRILSGKVDQAVTETKIKPPSCQGLIKILLQPLAIGI